MAEVGVDYADDVEILRLVFPMRMLMQRVLLLWRLLMVTVMMMLGQSRPPTGHRPATGHPAALGAMGPGHRPRRKKKGPSITTFQHAMC